MDGPITNFRRTRESETWKADETFIELHRLYVNRKQVRRIQM